MAEAIQILNILKEKSEEVKEEFSEKYLTPFDNVVKLLNSVKKQFLEMIDKAYLFIAEVK